MGVWLGCIVCLKGEQKYRLVLIARACLSMRVGVTRLEEDMLQTRNRLLAPQTSELALGPCQRVHAVMMSQNALFRPVIPVS